MTMYNSKLAVCIKAAGKVLREQKDQVFLPFGSEYSIFIKNLNTVRALVRIQLDGVDVCDGTDLVVGPNGSIDLERFMKAGNLSEGNRFKFIERTGKVEAHRGIQAEDGLLRVEFQFEKPVVDWKKAYEEKKEIHNHYYNDWWRHPYDRYPPSYYYPTIWHGGGSGWSCSNNVGSSQVDVQALTSNSIGNPSVNCSATSTGDAVPKASSGILRSMNVNFAQSVMDSAPINDAGITVPGSLSNQSFTVVASFPVEDEKHVIVLKLLGETQSGKAIAEPVTVKYKQTCVTCGTRNRGKLSNFCRECGTSLELA